MPRRLCALTFATALAPTLLVGAGEAEARQLPPVQIQGKVIDDATDEPLEGVTITVLDSYGQRLARRVTDEFGAFSLEVRHRAGVRIRAARLGYREALTPWLDFDGRHFFSIEIRLDTDVILLAPLEVVASARAQRSPVLEGFDDRLRSGVGSYFTRDDIERIQPGRVSDLLGRLPGVRLEGAGRGNRRIVTMARAGVGPGGGACPAQIFVDGMLVTRGPAQNVSVDDLVVPSVVEGIEVYHGLSTVPAEFLNPESRCGVVAIWTRRGGDRP